MGIKDTIEALGVTLKNFLKKPVTVQYPRERRELPERYRGIFVLTRNEKTGEENCIGCRLCENICPSEVIKVIPERKEKRTYAKEFTLNMGACMFCELCVQVCPTDAIQMVRTMEFSSFTRDGLILNKEELLRNFERFKGNLSWSKGSTIRKMQAPPRPERRK